MKIFWPVFRNVPTYGELIRVVYVDMEAKYGNDPEYLRGIFEKVIGVSLKQNSMKLMFKKYLEFEIKNGTVSRQNYVKKKAEENFIRMMKSKGNAADLDDDLENGQEN